MGPKAEEQQAPSCWIVICPEPSIRGLWARWYRENCVAIGWGPPNWSMEGQSDPSVGFIHGFHYARNCLRRIRPGDKVIPFLKEWRIGPVGTVREVRVRDDQFEP